MVDGDDHSSDLDNSFNEDGSVRSATSPAVDTEATPRDEKEDSSASKKKSSFSAFSSKLSFNKLSNKVSEIKDKIIEKKNALVLQQQIDSSSLGFVWNYRLLAFSLIGHRKLEIFLSDPSLRTKQQAVEELHASLAVIIPNTALSLLFLSLSSLPPSP
jgi:hypothetical protein